MAGSVRYLDRKLLRNVLRHTEVHNRLQEEKDMWKQRRDPRHNRNRYEIIDYQHSSISQIM